jgi:hypothetical protein
MEKSPTKYAKFPPDVVDSLPSDSREKSLTEPDAPEIVSANALPANDLAHPNLIIEGLLEQVRLHEHEKDFDAGSKSKESQPKVSMIEEPFPSSIDGRRPSFSIPKPSKASLNSAISFRDPDHVRILAGLHLAGYSIRTDEQAETGTALKLMEIESAKEFVYIALVLSFNSGLCGSGEIKVVSGQYVGDDRCVTFKPFVTDKNVAIHEHVEGVEQLRLFGVRGPRYYKKRLLLSPVLPLEFTMNPIMKDGAVVPFTWNPPEVDSGQLTTPGYFLICANDIETFDQFVVGSAEALGKPLARQESQFAHNCKCIGKKATLQSRVVGVALLAICAFAVLASFHVLPYQMTLFLLENYPLLIVVAAVLLAVAQTISIVGKKEAKLEWKAHASRVAPRSPFHVEPEMSVVIDAAARLGPDLFPLFRSVFCYRYSPSALDEIEERVFKRKPHQDQDKGHGTSSMALPGGNAGKQADRERGLVDIYKVLGKSPEN